jgi:hypothetical protein
MATETTIEQKTFSFTLTLVTPPIETADEMDALHSALHMQGCSEDGSLSSSAGIAHLHFDREAPDLAEAIGWAVKAVLLAGYSVSHVEVEQP